MSIDNLDTEITPDDSQTHTIPEQTQEYDKRTTLHLLKHLVTEEIQNARNIQEMEQLLKNNLLSTYTQDDFNLDRLYVGVTQTPQAFNMETVMYSHFDNLEDAIDCCIASSHVPFVTGHFQYMYRNQSCYDGGFLRDPYLYLKKIQFFTSHPVCGKEERTPVLYGILSKKSPK